MNIIFWGKYLAWAFSDSERNEWGRGGRSRLQIHKLGFCHKDWMGTQPTRLVPIAGFYTEHAANAALLLHARRSTQILRIRGHCAGQWERMASSGKVLPSSNALMDRPAWGGGRYICYWEFIESALLVLCSNGHEWSWPMLVIVKWLLWHRFLTLFELSSSQLGH